jgi:hypothetical protein
MGKHRLDKFPDASSFRHSFGGAWGHGYFYKKGNYNALLKG